MTEPELGCCVYCVVQGGERPSFEGLEGVDPRFGVDAVTYGGLTALVSRVRLDEFGAEALKRHLEDLEWLERAARAHDAVLARALDCDAVVPLRLCTIFTDEAHVREMIERERELLLDALGRLRGRSEWSVKVLADPRGLEAAAREHSPALAATSAETEGASPGRSFFARKQLDRALRDEARALAEAAAEEVHIRLEQAAAGAKLLPPQHPDLSGRSGSMVLNGAYLVERSRAEQFAAIVGELHERHRRMGLAVELSGPWAPYNFVTPPEAQP